MGDNIAEVLQTPKDAQITFPEVPTGAITLLEEYGATHFDVFSSMQERI